MTHTTQTAVETFVAMLTDPWLMAGLGIGCIVLAIVVWLLRDERRMIRADRGHEDSACRYTPRHIVVMGVDDEGRGWYAPHCERCTADGPLFPARHTSEAWDALYAWEHSCERVPS